MWSQHALRESKQVRNYRHRTGNSVRGTCGMHFTNSQVMDGSSYQGKVTLKLWNPVKNLFFSSSLSVVHVPSAVGGRGEFSMVVMEAWWCSHVPLHIGLMQPCVSELPSKRPKYLHLGSKSPRQLKRWVHSHSGRHTTYCCHRWLCLQTIS